jgi:dihydropteroate synthase
MGVINLTPDSFSGDGLYGRPEEAAALAEELHALGADILDIGGESTRPGAQPVPVEEELRRVLPALRLIVRRVPIPISVDTSKAEVARRALDEGATIINDVSGLGDPDMAGVVADADAGLALVHAGPPPAGEDLVVHIVTRLACAVAEAEEAGVNPGNIVVDPGIGMGKGWRLSAEGIWSLPQENFEIMRRLPELRRLGKPILVGPSRKGMIRRVLGPGASAALDGTIALAGVCIAFGADVVRVHDVKPVAQAVRVMDALVRD